ncbi:MAG: LysM peptidoglycan-binding domain-containing protein [Alphaproteobacteria bacterium]|nr:LysM peptidoglycan-binding domain-containing protein [Alphaproteobacteria bacterium]
MSNTAWDDPLASPPPPAATGGIITGSSTVPPRTAGHPRQVFVRPGDTAYSIARNNAITVAQLGAANNIGAPYALAIGQRLTIPTARADHTRTGSIAPARPAAPRYQTSTLLVTVAPGDTLFSISKRYGTTVAEVARLNRIPPPYALRLGQRLTVPGRAVPAQTIPRQAIPRQAVQPVRTAAAPARQARPATGKSRNGDYIYYFHKVKPGETLPGIAQQYRIGVATLATFNQLQQSARLRTGQVIRVPM